MVVTANCNGAFLTLSSFLLLLAVYGTDATNSAGCGSSLPDGLSAGGASKPFSITSGGRTRTSRVYIPKNYNINTAAPLILSYHGNTKTAKDQEKISEFSLEKWNSDFVVVYPNGINKAWQGASYSAEGVDDVEFTSDLLDHLESKLCINTNRLYASGKSNGGGFVGLLTCDAKMSQRITAFAAVSGAFYPQTREPCNPSGNHVPIMEFHGMADDIIPYYGGTGRGGGLPSISSWLEDKAARDKVWCSKQPDNREVLKNGLVWKDAWYCGETSGKRVLVAFNETKMEHKWPGTEQTGADLVQATPRVIEFLKEWP